jgi:arsenate reductase
MNEERIDVLFVCTHNAGRSVAAKTLFNDQTAKLGLDLRAESAGTNPGERVNPSVRRVLESFKIDTSGELPKLMTDEMLAHKPRMVTMGCEVDAESCPAVNFIDAEDWGLPDPSKMIEDAEIVPLIHEIARRVNTLLQEMVTTDQTALR